MREIPGSERSSATYRSVISVALVTCLTSVLLLALPRSDIPCCSPACPSLWKHLSLILSPERLVRARTIDGLDVLNEKFDTNLFDSLTNKLIVDVEES
jgi:hypothetical protein